MGTNYHHKKPFYTNHVHSNPYTSRVIGTALVILVVPLLLLNHKTNICYASNNARPLGQRNKNEANPNKAPLQFSQYRQRVESLIESEGFITKIWRSHRSYPYIQRAIELSLNNKNTEALKIYDTYLKADPKHLLMQWDRLILLDTMKRSQRLEAAASDFLVQANGFGPALIFRALARKNLKWNEKAEEDWMAALQDADLTAEDRLRATSELVFSTYQRNAYLESLQWCDRMMKSKPPAIDDMIFRAGLLEKLERWQEAKEQWNLVIDKKPEPTIHCQAVLAEAVLLQKLGKNKAAFTILLKAHDEQQFDSFTASRPQRETYYLLLAHLAELSSRIDVAIHCYENLMDSDLDDSARFSLARLYVINNQENKIFPLLFRQPEVALNSTTALKRMLDLVHLLVRKNKFQLASNLLDKSIPEANKIYKKNKADQDAESLWVHYLAARSMIYGNSSHHLQLESTLVQIVGITGKYQYQMDYAAVLITNGKPEEAIRVLDGMIKRNKLSPHHHAQAYAMMASALGKTKQFTEEARAWIQAYMYENKPIYHLYCIQAYQKAGDLQAVVKIAQDYPVEQLKPEEQVTWHEIAAQAWLQLGALNKSKTAWQRAASLKPSALYYCQISDILALHDDLGGAEAAVEEALKIEPQHPYAMERLAYIKIQQGDNEKAAILFEGLKEIGWDKYQTAADLGFAYVRMGKNELAYQNLVAGVDKALSTDSYDAILYTEKQVALASMRHQIAEIDRQFDLLIADSFHPLSNGDGVLQLSSSTQWFNMGVGMIEVGFRPPQIGYDSGRTLTLFGRMMWPNSSDNLSPQKETLQAGLGLKYKPFKQTNLLFSAEQLFGLGDEIDDRPLLRIAHSITQMPSKDYDPQDMALYSRYLPYRQFYTDIGKEFGYDNSWFFSHETRIGNDLSSKENRFALLFGYLQAKGIISDNDDFAQVQTGMGLSMQWLGAFDGYKGYGREVELMLRCGYVAYDSNHVSGVSSLIGIRVSFY